MQTEMKAYIQNGDTDNFNLLKQDLVVSNGRFELFSFYAADETDRPRKRFRFNNLEKMMKYIEENELLTGETLYIFDTEMNQKIIEICPYENVFRFL